MRRTRSHSNGIGHQLSTRLKAGAPPSRLAHILTAAQGHSCTGLLPTQSIRLGSDWTTKHCRSVLLFGSASISALHNSVDVGLLSNQTAFINFHAVSVLVDFLDTAINNIIKRSLDTADLHSILEPVGLDHGDGRRPDEVTLFPFKGGKAMAWDATCTDSFSTSDLYSTIHNPGSASNAAEHLKRLKYSQLVADFEFVPVAVETSGIIGSAGCSLLTGIGFRILRATNDPARYLASFNRFQLPSSEATPWP